MGLAKRNRISTLDYVFSVLSENKTPIDFAFILHLPYSPSVEALELGAASARNKFPITNSFLYRRHWETFQTNINTLEVTLDEAAQQRFIDTPFDLRIEPPCRQLLIQRKTGSSLVTRFHHAAADGLSAAMWIGHQLQVALSLEEIVDEPADCGPPLFKRTSPSVWRSKFAYSKPSSSLKTCTTVNSNRRGWRSFSFDAAKLKQLCRRAGGFSYSDLLAVCALEVLIDWNQRHGDETRVGLWLPINIRSSALSGFGNGTSRIRIYPRYERQASFVDKAREVRRQVKWCTDNGEWVVPNIPSLSKVPAWLSAPLLNTYLGSRYVDMGTAVFSHGESLAGGVGDGLQTAESIECVGLLQKQQRLAINGTTHRGKTSLTFTYDSGLFCEDAVKLLCEAYQKQIDTATQELTNARTS